MLPGRIYRGNTWAAIFPISDNGDRQRSPVFVYAVWNKYCLDVPLFMPVRDPSLRQIVWREFDIDAVAHQDADAVAAHAARDRGEHHVLGVI